MPQKWDTSGSQCYVAIENLDLAAASYLPKSPVDVLGLAVRPEAGTSLAVEFRTMEKFRRYRPDFDEDAAQDFNRYVPFIVDAIGGPKKREQLAGNNLTKIGGAIARFNAMATLRHILAAW